MFIIGLQILISYPMRCQRCRVNLKPHKSVSGKLISNHFLNTPKEKALESIIGADDPHFARLAESMNPFTQEPNSGFNLEEQLDLLSGEIDTDLVLCINCTENVKVELKAEYLETCQLRDNYAKILDDLNKQPQESDEEYQKLVSEVGKLNEEYSSLLAKLKTLEVEQTTVQIQTSEAQSKATELQTELEDAMDYRNDLELDLSAKNLESRRLTALLEYQSNQLQTLKRANVYENVFDIKEQGEFGTISGLRLGKLKDSKVKVEWSEVNAALGQTLFLFHTLAQKLDISVSDYGFKLRPLGSMSKIEVINNDGSLVLDLFSQGDYTFERLFSHRKLDSAMAAMLQILAILGQRVEQMDENLRLPYRIDNDKIGNFSIKLGQTSYDSWTKACKYMLANAKWILAYAISH